MNIIFTIILEAMLLLVTPDLKSEIVVLPSQSQSFESYKEVCSKENLTCTFTKIKEKILVNPTPKYDQLILDLDLQSVRFTASLSERIKQVVETEMISTEQLESIVNILQRAEEVSPDKSKKILKVELIQLHEIVMKAPNADDFKYFIFKKPISSLSMERLKSFSIRPYFKEIDFKKETIDQNPIYFKIGKCSHSRLSDLGLTYFNETNYIFADDDNCSWTDSVTQAFKNDASSESNFRLTQKQKNTVLWSAVAIGAGLFLSQYELSFEY